MHRSLAIAFLGIAFIIAGMVSASAGPNGFKIGYVDFDRVLGETAAGKRATKEFEKTLKTKQAELDKQQKSLQEAVAQLQKQASVIKPAVRQQREQELQKQYVQLQETYVKLERELVEKRTKLIQKIIKQASPVIKDLAKSEGFDMIVDRSVVVWADTAYDVTGKIKDRMK